MIFLKNLRGRVYRLTAPYRRTSASAQDKAYLGVGAKYGSSRCASAYWSRCYEGIAPKKRAIQAPTTSESAGSSTLASAASARSPIRARRASMSAPAYAAGNSGCPSIPRRRAPLEHRHRAVRRLASTSLFGQRRDLIGVHVLQRTVERAVIHASVQDAHGQHAHAPATCRPRHFGAERLRQDLMAEADADERTICRDFAMNASAARIQSASSYAEARDPVEIYASHTRGSGTCPACTSKHVRRRSGICGESSPSNMCDSRPRYGLSVRRLRRSRAARYALVCRLSPRAQVRAADERLRPRERLEAQPRERAAAARVLDARPRERGIEVVAAIHVPRPGVDAFADAQRGIRVRRPH